MFERIGRGRQGAGGCGAHEPAAGRVKRPYTLASATLLTVLMAAGFLVGYAAPAIAYLEDGHFYTSFVALTALQDPQFDPRSRQTIAFCAQLPDKAWELDATYAYQLLFGDDKWNYLRWAVATSMDRATIRRMITVQQLLHALTGGKSEAVKKVALDTARTLRDVARASHDDCDLCAYGFAIHLLGDAFAHRDLRDETVMYPTGVGHGPDLTLPDRPLYNARREQLWEQWLETAACLADGDNCNWQMPSELSLPAISKKTGGSWSCFLTGCHEDDLRQLLVDELGRVGVPKDTLWRPESEKEDPKRKCDDFIHEMAKTGALPKDTTIDCQTAWPRFRDVASRKFIDTKDSRSRDFDGFKDYFIGDITDRKVGGP